MRTTPGWTCSSMAGCPMPAPTLMPGSPLLRRKLGKIFVIEACHWLGTAFLAQCNFQYIADLHVSARIASSRLSCCMPSWPICGAWNWSLAEGALSCAAGRSCSRFPMLVSPQSSAPELYQSSQSLHHLRAQFCRRRLMLGNS